MSELLSLLPPEGVKILLTLFLCFLIGLEREEHKLAAPYTFGGVRTFPMLGLMGYALALLSGGELLPVAVGLVVVGGLMMISYWHKLQSQTIPGITTEVSALLTYVIGALVQRGYDWVAVTLVVLSMLLLQLKKSLEGLSHRFAGEDILAFTKFLLLSAVILPAVPNREFTSFQINPFKTWLVVVAVSSVSYGSYLLQKALKNRGVLASAILGGAYSSTVTTVTLAKKARDGNRPNLYAGAILMASGVMYLRLILLLAMFNRGLMLALAPSFGALGAAALLAGGLWSRRTDARGAAEKGYPSKNPLDLDAAFLFAAIFVGILILTHLALAYLGRAGIYTLAGLMGLTDVDPFIMGLTQTAGSQTPLNLAAAAVVIAAASNNALKGVYAFGFADRRTGRASLLLLLGLAAAGLIPLLLL